MGRKIINHEKRTMKAWVAIDRYGKPFRYRHQKQGHAILAISRTKRQFAKWFGANLDGKHGWDPYHLVRVTITYERPIVEPYVPPTREEIEARQLDILKRIDW